MNHLMQNPVRDDLAMSGTVENEDAHDWWKQWSSMVKEDQKKSDQLFDVMLEKLFIAGQESTDSV